MRLTRRLRGAVMARMGINNTRVTPSGLYAFIPFQPIGSILDKQTINGSQGTTVLEYRGCDIANDGSNWVALTGPTLTKSAFGTVPKIGAPSALPDGVSESVGFTNSTSSQYLAADSSGADLGTDDLLFTFFGSVNISNGGGAATGRSVLGKASASSMTAGMWRFGGNSVTSGSMGVALHIGGARFELVATIHSSTTYTDALVQIYIDRSDTNANTGIAIYANGKRVATGTFTSAQAATALTNASKVCIAGADGASTTSTVMTGDVHHIRLEKRANWFAGGAQNLADWDAAALAFASNIFGWTASTFPTTASAYPSAYGGNTGTVNAPTLHPDGSVKIARMSSVVDGLPVAYHPKHGYCLWPSEDSSNDLRQTNAFTDASWIKTNLTVASSATEVGMFLGDPAFSCVPTAIDAVHTLARTTVSSLAANTYTHSIFIKPTGKMVWKLDGGTNRTAYFVFPESPALGDWLDGTSLGSSTLRASALYYGGGWWRISQTFTTSTSATQTLTVSPVASVGTDNFLGDGSTVAGFVSCAQIEAQPYATHYMNSTSSSATRSLAYSQEYGFAPDAMTTGRIEVTAALTPDMATQKVQSAVNVFVNGTTVPRMILAVGTTNALRWTVRASGSAVNIADLTGSPVITPSATAKTKLIGSFAPNDYKAIVGTTTVASQASGGTSTAGHVGNFTNGIPADIAAANVGCQFGVSAYAIYATNL